MTVEAFGVPLQSGGEVLYLMDAAGNVFSSTDYGRTVAPYTEYDVPEGSAYHDIAVSGDGRFFASLRMNDQSRIYELFSDGPAGEIFRSNAVNLGLGTDAEGFVYSTWADNSETFGQNPDSSRFWVDTSLGGDSVSDVTYSGDLFFTAIDPDNPQLVVGDNVTNQRLVAYDLEGIAPVGFHVGDDYLMIYAFNDETAQTEVYSFDLDAGTFAVRDEEGAPMADFSVPVALSIVGIAAAPYTDTAATEGDDELFYTGEAEMSGLGGDDLLVGGRAAEVLQGGDGDDEIFGRGNDDVIDGGAGDKDVAKYALESALIDVELDDGQVIVTAFRNGEQEQDVLSNVEFIGMEDTTLNLAQIDNVVDLPQDDLEFLAQMYVAYFDRAPDSEGLFYWADQLNGGMSLPAIAESFFVQPESRAKFPDPDDSEKLVNDAYWNLLERAPDAAGEVYWIAALESGNVSRGQFMLALINGARENPDPTAAEDRRTIEDKGDIALQYAAVKGLTDAEDATEVMSVYERTDPDTKFAARDLIDEFADKAAATDGSGELTISLLGGLDGLFE